MAIPLAPLNKGASGYAWAASDLEAVSTNPEDYLPKEESPPLELQPLDNRPALPDHEKNKRAFYSAMLEGDPNTFKENYIATEADLTISKDSPLYDKHAKSWEAEQTANIEGDVNNILLDPSVPTAQKMQVLKQFQNGEFISKDLEDKYIQQVASEDIHETVADKKSQDIMLPTILETIQKHRTVEDIKAEALAVESGSGWGDVIAGMARDVIVPGSYLAESFWIQQGISEALGEKTAERIGSNLRSIFLQGTNNANIGKVLDSIIEPEKKADVIRAIINYNQQFPGNSFNKWSQYVDKIDQGEMGPIETAIEDFFGWADFVGAGKLITSPIRTFRYLTTLEMGGKSRSLFKGYGLDTIGKTPNIADIKAREAAEAKQNEVASNPPTGAEISPDDPLTRINRLREGIDRLEKIKSGPNAERLWKDMDETLLSSMKAELDELTRSTPNTGAIATPVGAPEQFIQDASGKPQVYYHGTTSDTVELTPSGDIDAIFVSPSPDFSEAFSRGEGGRTIPVNLKKSNLFDPTNKEHLDRLLKQIRTANKVENGQITYTDRSVDGSTFTNTETLDFVISSLKDTPNRASNFSEMEKPYVQDAIKALGFDGFKVKEMDVENIGIYNKDLVVSAIENRPQEIVPPSQLISIGVQPAVKETSPIGITKAASPTKARELATQAILDPAVARASGAEPGEIVGSFALEKLDDDFIKNNPDIAKDLEKWDREFNNLYDEVKLDPYLVDTVERTVEKERIYRTFQETQGAYYQASNSTLNESLGAIEGRARYGRNADFGFNSAEEAIAAEKHINENFPNIDTSKHTTSIVQENGQWYVDMHWKREYDPLTARTMDVEASFLGFNVSSFARTHVSKYIMPPTTRLPEWFTKGGYLNSVTALRIEEQFNRMLKNIQDTKFKEELDETLITISENQKYLTEGDVAAKFPHLNEAGRTELMKKQYQWKRLSEYAWNITNRIERSRLEAEGMQGIYKADGTHLRNGKATDQVPTSVDEVWNFDMETGVKRPKDPQGMQLVKLDEPIRIGGDVFEYAMVGGGTKLDILPSAVVPKIEGYVPRMNIEPWYVKVHPRSIRVNGRTVSDVNELREKHTRTIGAAKDVKDAEQLVKKLQEEMGDDFVVGYARERADVGDAILTDFKVYKEKTDYGKTRGDRLPTIDGFARLEHPFVAASKRIRTLSRLDAWRGYDEIAKKNFMNRFSAFLPKGEFPNTIHDIKLPKEFVTEDIIKSFNEAQRIFEQYSNSKYKINRSDVVWKAFGHKIADKIEGWQNNLPAEKVREIANKGDLFRKGIKSLGTNLFLNLGPAAQWIVQTQVILPFAMVERGFRNSMHMLPALMISTLGKASHGKPYKKLIDEAAATLSMEKRAEFEAIADAIYKVGIPQGVDLNMMLHGGLDEISQPLVKGLGQKSVDAIGQVISTPGRIGKTIGYTPAQLMADMAGFLFAKARWERMNPGKNWNTPTHIRQIAGDAWDIMGSMASRAGAMPMQDGYLGVLFQFMTILHKNMFTLFSSKSLKKAPGEVINPKVKLAAANMAIFGIYGVPASSAVYWLWEQFFGDEVDPETLARYQKYRGGLVDLVTNATIDTFFAEEGDRPMDLAIAKRIGPMPETVPYVDLGWELASFMLGNKTDNPRFPFVNATGAVFDAVRDAYNIVAATPELNTVDAVMVWASELAEATSGFNNYGKAAAIAELNDKKNKFGSNLGLELNYKHAVAQVFGITSQQEVAHYEMMNNMKEREQYINDRVTKLSQDMEKLKDKIGTPDFEEYVRRAKVLNAATREEDREEIFRRFTQRDRQEWLTKRQSMMKYFIEHHKGQNDYNLKQMEATFINGTPNEQQFLDFINRNLSGTAEQE